MELIYREIMKNDEEEVKRLIVDLVKLLALENNPLRLKEPLPKYADNFFRKMEEHIHKGTGMIYVAEVGKKVVAYVAGYIKQQTPEELLEYKKIKLGYIPDLFVVDEFRGRGIGIRLLQIIEKYLIDLECDYIGISVAAKNFRAYHVYKKQGYQNQLIEMTKFVK